MTAGLLAAFSTFLLFLIGHAAIFQLFTIVKKFNAMVLTWLVLLAAYAGLHAAFVHCLPPAWVATGVLDVVNGAVVYFLLFLVYCCLYFTDHSLSVAYMIELEHRPGRVMTRTELKERFPHDTMLRQRFSDLIANSYVVQEGECYRLTPKGKLFAASLGMMKHFLKLEPGG